MPKAEPLQLTRDALDEARTKHRVLDCPARRFSRITATHLARHSATRVAFELVLWLCVAASLVCKKLPTGEAPDTPPSPMGISNGGYGTSYEFRTTTTDKDSDSICFRFQWGDNSTSDWSYWIASGETTALWHAWLTPGTFAVRTQARDRPGLTSEWSTALPVTIIATSAPSTPGVPTGPSTSRKDSLCTFTTIATDPDGDGVSYRFNWGNGDTSAWTDWVPSGQPGSMQYAFRRAGQFGVRAQARDVNEALSVWSNPHSTTIVNPSPPGVPDVPSGPTDAKPDIPVQFESAGDDPDGDSIAIRFCWGGRDTSDWSALVRAGWVVSMNHVWPDTGIYEVKAQAADEDGAVSAWTAAHKIDIHENRPNAPSVPAGPLSGQRGTLYEFRSSATDPECESTCVRFAWGDGDTSEWSNFVPSGESAAMGHIWQNIGVYAIRAQARNESGALSKWSYGSYFDAGPRLKWRFQTGSDIVSSPAIGSDGTVYVGSEDSCIYAIDANGALRWRYKTGGSVSSAPVLSVDGTVYVGASNGCLYALTATGTLKWSVRTGDAIYASPALGSDGTIFIEEYHILSERFVVALRPDGTLKWRYSIGYYYISYTPAIGADGVIYFGTSDNDVRAVNQDGTLKWRYTGDGWFISAPAIGDDGTIYVGSADACLYALSHEGELRWKYETYGDIEASPVIDNAGTIYVGSQDGSLYAINADGSLKWSFDVGSWVRSSPSLCLDGTVYVGTYGLRAINPDGSRKWRFVTDQFIRSSSAVGSDGTIYVGSDDGCLYAVEGSVAPSTAPWPKFQHDVRNTGRQGGP